MKTYYLQLQRCMFPAKSISIRRFSIVYMILKSSVLSQKGRARIHDCIHG